MPDRLTLYLAKSIAKHLGDNVSGLDAAYVIQPDFDYDSKPDIADPRARITRELPFITVLTLEDLREPFSVSANILQTADMTYMIGVYAGGVSQLLNITGDTKQVLAQAAHPVSAEVGIPLYDYGTASGVYFDLKGAIDIFEFGSSQFLGPADTDQFENRKHRSLTPIVFSAFKDKDATLIENLGNVRFND